MKSLLIFFYLTSDFQRKKLILNIFSPLYRQSAPMRKSNRFLEKGKKLMLMNSCTGGFLLHNESCHSEQKCQESVVSVKFYRQHQKFTKISDEVFLLRDANKRTREYPVIVMTTFMVFFPFQYQRCYPRAVALFIRQRFMWKSISL